MTLSEEIDRAIKWAKFNNELDKLNTSIGNDIDNEDDNDIDNEDDDGYAES